MVTILSGTSKRAFSDEADAVASGLVSASVLLLLLLSLLLLHPPEERRHGQVGLAPRHAGPRLRRHWHHGGGG